MVPYPLFEGARALVLAVLLGMSIASPAQSTDSDTNTDTISDSDSSDTWSSDLKAPLRPADDVGGSWNWALLYGRMTNASLVDDVIFNFG